jgi:hypothetical protein
MRPNKLEHLSLETLSSQVLEFEGEARCFLLGELLVLPANARLDWKVIARYKHSGLFRLVIFSKEKIYIVLTPGPTAIQQFAELRILLEIEV